MMWIAARRVTCVAGSLVLLLSLPALAETGSGPESPHQGPLTRCFTGLVHFYQKRISGHLGDRCRFEPSCSNYALEAAQDGGALLGVVRASERLQRCHPWADPFYEELTNSKLSDPYPGPRPKGKRLRRIARTVCSAVLPGSGQALEGRWGDAGVSFAFFALPAGLTIFLAEQEDPEWALIPGTVSGLFYVGNLSGAYRIPEPVRPAGRNPWDE